MFFHHHFCLLARSNGCRHAYRNDCLKSCHLTISHFLIIRQRDRYRERDNLPEGNEGNLRTNARQVQQDAITSNPSTGNQPTVVLSGARPFSGQLPTILHSRERSDECGSSYEDNIDGRSKDSGDTGSVGEPDTVSALEGQSTGFPSAQRHGSRGSKSRQIVDRRERDARREGKWERKH